MKYHAPILTLVSILSLMLAGCFSTSRAKTAYLLTPRASNEALPYVRIGDSFHGSGSFFLPRYVDGTGMKVRISGNQVTSLNSANWAISIGEMVRSTLAQNLALLAGPAAKGAPVAQASQFQFSRFDGEDGARFVVSGTCLLNQGRRSRMIFFQESLAWNGTPAGLVNCHDQAILAIARQLAREAAAEK